jgi:hypothetical protein
MVLSGLVGLSRAYSRTPRLFRDFVGVKRLEAHVSVAPMA